MDPKKIPINGRINSSEIWFWDDNKNDWSEVNSETLSFLEGKCRNPGRPLSAAIPNATPDALDLLEHLLDLNPNRRPSAISALEFTYLQDADIICDYTNVAQPAPLDENYFAFERNSFTVEALRQMIADEVAAMQSLN